MKLGFHGATSMTASLETDVQVSAEAGFCGLEVWTDKLEPYLAQHSLVDLAVLFSRHQVQPLALDALVFVGWRGGEYPLVQEQCRRFSRIAHTIGCPTIVTVPSPLPDRSLTWDEIKAEYVSVLRDLGGIAADEGVRLAFECLGFGWSSIRTPRAAAEIVRAVNLRNVGLTLDTAHFYGGGGLLSEIEALDPARIFALHLVDLEDLPKEAITDANRLFPGQGVVPLGDILAALKKIGYTGHASVEMFRPEYWQRDPQVVARQAREAALQVLSPYFTVE